jgi:hypothetical protein
VVRTLARVAAIMPKKPAAAEQIAPTRKDTAVWMPRPDTDSATKMTATDRPISISSRRMKAEAPCWIINAIWLGLPSMAG